MDLEVGAAAKPRISSHEQDIYAHMVVGRKFCELVCETRDGARMAVVQFSCNVDAQKVPREVEAPTKPGHSGF